MLAQSHEQLNKSYAIHCHKLLNQCLQNDRLSHSWRPVIEGISRKIGSSVVIPFRIQQSNPTDHISHCVQIKTIPGGDKEDSTTFNGVVINKNVSHRKSRQDIQNPRILLFSTSIMYDGDEQRLTSLDTIIAKEKEYLETILSKIISAKPDIVIVEHAVARIAQQILLDRNITLISNLKHSLMLRIARFTHAKIIYSLDSIYKPGGSSGTPTQHFNGLTTTSTTNIAHDYHSFLDTSIGSCERFYCQAFGSKTYALLDGCNEKLGATVILRGGCLPELKRVKKLCAFMIFCDYNWRLERSLLIDQYALLSKDQEEHLNELINTEDQICCKKDPDRRLSIIDKDDLLVGHQANKPEPVVVEDNSDPLRSMNAEMSSSFNLSSNFMTITNDISEHKYRKRYNNITHQNNCEESDQCTWDTKKHEELKLFEIALTTAMLSCSPNIVYPLLPIMKADSHTEKLIEYFRGHLLWSKRLPELRGDFIVREEVYEQYDNHQDGPHEDIKNNKLFYTLDGKGDFSKHPLLEYELSKPLKETPQVHSMIADFRARGAYPFDNCGKQVASTFKELKSHLADIQRANICQLAGSSSQSNNHQIETNTTANSNQSTNLKSRSSLTLPIVTGVLSSHNNTHDTNTTNGSISTYSSNNFGFAKAVGRQKDCLDPLNNQFMAVLFSSYSSLSTNAPDYCVKPSTIKMNYYGENDLPLGEFLERYCFDNNYQCPSHGCSTSVMKHTRRFVHGDGCIMIALRSFPHLKPGIIDEKSIVTWSWCRDCKSATPYVELSEDSKNLSFAKYLELRFYGHSYNRRQSDTTNNHQDDVTDDDKELSSNGNQDHHAVDCSQRTENHDKSEKLYNNFQKPCKHSLYRDHCQFFAYNRIIASFIYLQASLYEIVLPSFSPLAPDSLDLEPIPDDQLSFIREDDYGSLISFALNSAEYRKQLSDLKATLSDNSNTVIDYKSALSPIARHKLLSSIQSTIMDSYGGLSTPGSVSIEQLDRFIASDKENSDSESNMALDRNSSGSNLTKQDFVASSSYVVTPVTTASCNSNATITPQLGSSSSSQHQGTADSKKPYKNKPDSAISTYKPLVINNNIELQLTDGNVSLYCVVYCATEFQNIRSLLLRHPNGEELYKQSLWNCIAWSAPGGKSGSTFCKTTNDRFIMKEMSKLEVQSFLAISNNYFDYIQKSYSEKQPCLLSTILGIYRINYKNTTTNTSSKLYFLVMQNLFYQRQITQRFDLKGSMRNRLVNTDDTNKGSSDLVLMDENLLRITCDHPLFIRAHSKIILNQAIHNDASFLTSLSVMDYSLLVGIDKEKNELVLGIIDYVRPFTWDKKIERVVKSVGSAKMPTIIEPDLYRIRFCEAMDKYFECVPDHWHDLINYCDEDDTTTAMNRMNNVDDIDSCNNRDTPFGTAPTTIAAITNAAKTTTTQIASNPICSTTSQSAFSTASQSNGITNGSATHMGTTPLIAEQSRIPFSFRLPSSSIFQTPILSSSLTAIQATSKHYQAQ